MKWEPVDVFKTTSSPSNPVPTVGNSCISSVFQTVYVPAESSDSSYKITQMVPRFLKALLPRLGPVAFNHLSYIYLHFRSGVWPPLLSFSNPTRFNEKLIWLKMNYRAPNASLLADKLAVKSFLLGVIDERHIIPTLGVYQTADEINFEELPVQCVLKTNHGSGFNVIVKDKNAVDQSEVKRKLNKWIKINYFDETIEYQYKDIKPLIFAERFLCPNDGGDLRDYKFFCFDGIPKVVQVDCNRHQEHQRNFYDLDWNRLEFTSLYPPYARTIQKPEKLDLMVELAKTLSVGLPFVRIDLFECQDEVYFGEITFHHGGGFEPILPECWDFKLGSFIDLKTMLDC